MISRLLKRTTFSPMHKETTTVTPFRGITDGPSHPARLARSGAILAAVLVGMFLLAAPAFAAAPKFTLTVTHFPKNPGTANPAPTPWKSATWGMPTPAARSPLPTPCRRA